MTNHIKSTKHLFGLDIKINMNLGCFLQIPLSNMFICCRLLHHVIYTVYLDYSVTYQTE